MNWTTTLTLSLATVLSTPIAGAVLQTSNYANAQASPAVFRSASGDTTFPASALGACAGKVVVYNTRYRGIAYQGNLWVQSPTGLGCEGGRGRTLQGYFEERGSNNAWCRGRLTVYLTNGPQGGSYVRWDQIATVPGYACPGAGTTPSLSLYYRDR